MSAPKERGEPSVETLLERVARDGISSIQWGEGNRFRQELADALRSHAQAEAAIEVLAEDAADEIEAWGAYADPYFQEKHGLKEIVAKFRAISSLSPVKPEGDEC